MSVVDGNPYTGLSNDQLEDLARQSLAPAEQERVQEELAKRYAAVLLGPKREEATRPPPPPRPPTGPRQQPRTPPKPSSRPAPPVAPLTGPGAGDQRTGRRGRSWLWTLGVGIAGLVGLFFAGIVALVVLAAIFSGPGPTPPRQPPFQPPPPKTTPAKSTSGATCQTSAGWCPLPGSAPPGAPCYCSNGLQSVPGFVR